MIGVVIVSHSARLAEGVVELAQQVAQDKVRLVAAGGTSDADNPIGTDAFRVLEAIETVFDEDGVLVFMDLGSAMLSAETALELLDENHRARVRLCSGPFVEGAISAVSLAAAGASLDEIVAGEKPTQLATSEERRVTVPNRLGIHARPAARLLRLARRFDAHVTLQNLTVPVGPFNAGSLNGLLSLRARQGHEILLRAQGPQARQVLEELTAFVDAGCGDVDDASQVPPSLGPGIGASAGIAIAPLIRLHPAPATVSQQFAADPDTEWQRLQTALAATRDETHALYDWSRRHAGENAAGIFDAQSLMLEDADLIEQLRRHVLDDHRDAATAWQTAAQQLASLGDMADVSARVLAKITGAAEAVPVIDRPSILAAHDLLPSQVEKLDPAKVLGLCLAIGSASAHASILARARGIPAVVGLGVALSTIEEGTVVGIDGERGQLWVSPDAVEVHRLEQLRQSWLASREEAHRNRAVTTATRDGRRIIVLANLSREAQAAEAVENGAEGVGVLRTEFLFLDRQTAPDEDEQYACYCNIAEALGDRPLVVRTLDIGGDKGVPYIDIGPEANPFLGWRGIRVTLGRRDLFETQLRAILRAGQHHPVEILLPMVSTLDELREAKAIIAQLQKSFPKQVPIGVMIEVPSAAVMADSLAHEVSRLSLGTNDLVQYLMAADRTNARVASTADHFQPAVLRVIQNMVNVGRSAGVKVDVCGEMGADTVATPLLLGLGVEEFSVSPPLIPELKRAIASWTLPEAEALAREALQLESSEAIRKLLTQAKISPTRNSC